MKIYTIFDYYPDGYIENIHSIYLSKEKAQSVSNELRCKAYQEELQHLMNNEDMTENEAIDHAVIPRWLYEVTEFEVEE